MPPALPIDSTGDGEDHFRDASQSSVTQARRDQQRTFECAAEAIVCREGSCAGDPASFRVEIGNLESWASKTGALIPPEGVDQLALISNHTSEHEVFYRKPDDRAVKRTWPGVYGQIPVAMNGCLDRRNATPSEYLMRMALHIEVFASDIRLEGVSISDKPSMIIRQPAGIPMRQSHPRDQKFPAPDRPRRHTRPATRSSQRVDGRSRSAGGNPQSV